MGKKFPERLTIDGLPVSVASADLEGYLRKSGARLQGTIEWEKARDGNRALTRWITGRRTIWIDLPTIPLPHKLQVGSFWASLYYREQPKPIITCFDCHLQGHKRGDVLCTKPRSSAPWGAPSQTLVIPQSAEPVPLPSEDLSNEELPASGECQSSGSDDFEGSDVDNLTGDDDILTGDVGDESSGGFWSTGPGSHGPSGVVTNSGKKKNKKKKKKSKNSDNIKLNNDEEASERLSRKSFQTTIDQYSTGTKRSQSLKRPQNSPDQDLPLSQRHKKK